MPGEHKSEFVTIKETRWYALKDMIEKIVSTDRKSRELIGKTRQMRIESEQKISDMKEKKKNEYLEKARMNIKLMEQEEKIKAEKKLKQIEEKYKAVEDRISQAYDENYEFWVDMLVNRVIGR